MMTEDRDPNQDMPNGIQPEDIAQEGELDPEEAVARTVMYAFDEGKEKLRQNGGFDPFTITVKGDELFIEEHPGDDADESYASARRTVFQMALLCETYVLCYDGYVELDEGPSDAIIVECANKGDEQAQIIVCLYHQHGDEYHFDEDLYQVGETDNFFESSGPVEIEAVDAELEEAEGNKDDAGDEDGADHTS